MLCFLPLHTSSSCTALSSLLHIEHQGGKGLFQPLQQLDDADARRTQEKQQKACGRKYVGMGKGCAIGASLLLVWARPAASSSSASYRQQLSQSQWGL